MASGAGASGAGALEARTSGAKASKANDGTFEEKEELKSATAPTAASSSLAAAADAGDEERGPSKHPRFQLLGRNVSLKYLNTVDMIDWLVGWLVELLLGNAISAHKITCI